MLIVNWVLCRNIIFLGSNFISKIISNLFKKLSVVIFKIFLYTFTKLEIRYRSIVNHFQLVAGFWKIFLLQNQKIRDFISCKYYCLKIYLIEAWCFMFQAYIIFVTSFLSLSIKNIHSEKWHNLYKNGSFLVNQCFRQVFYLLHLFQYSFSISYFSNCRLPAVWCSSCSSQSSCFILLNFVCSCLLPFLYLG